VIADRIATVLGRLTLPETHVVRHHDAPIALEPGDELPVEVTPRRLAVKAYEDFVAFPYFVGVVLAKAVSCEVVRRERPRSLELLLPWYHDGASRRVRAFVGRGP
jgi:hypothetical protein